MEALTGGRWVNGAPADGASQEDENTQVQGFDTFGWVAGAFCRYSDYFRALGCLVALTESSHITPAVSDSSGQLMGGSACLIVTNAPKVYDGIAIKLWLTHFGK